MLQGSDYSCYNECKQRGCENDGSSAFSEAWRQIHSPNENDSLDTLSYFFIQEKTKLLFDFGI